MKAKDLCDRWKKFLNFKTDMGDPIPGQTIDRKDNDGNYEPGNCRWATLSEQQRNTSRNKMLSAAGKTMCLTQWAEEVGICKGTLWSRLKLGWSVEAALFTPIDTRARHKPRQEAQ